MMMVQDSGQKADGEEFDRVVAMCMEFADTIEYFGPGIAEALHAVSMLAGGLLTYEIGSRAEAEQMLDQMVASIKLGFDGAEQNGSASWLKTQAN